MRPLSDDDPARVGGYTLLGRLGSGAMGTVYLGRSRGGRRVAVKLVSAGLAEEPSFRDRFRHEVANMRRVGGFWTAGVVDADPDADRPWVATEYIEGPTLAEYVQEKGPLPEDEVLALGAALAEALVSVHEAGVVHRDLKPGNILISGDGPRVIDFGISRVLDQTTLTATGVAIGTPGFMSPEQVEAGEVGPASDVFALAGVLVYAATGNGPFPAGSLSSVLYAVAHGRPRLDDVPPHLRAVLEPCFAKEPTGRPNATQLLESLTPDHNPTSTTAATTTTLPAPAATRVVETRPASRPAPVTPQPLLPAAGPMTVANPDRRHRKLPTGFALGATCAGLACYGVTAGLLNQTIGAPVPPILLAISEFVPLVVTALVVLLRPFRTERTRFWGAFTLGFLMPAVITAGWVPYDNLLDHVDTMLVFCGHALAPVALLAVADIALARHTTGDPLGGTAQFALPLATWLVYFYVQAGVGFFGIDALSLLACAFGAVLMFVLLASASGRRLLDRFGLVIAIAPALLPVTLRLLGGGDDGPPSYVMALPLITFTIPFVVVRHVVTRHGARRRSGTTQRILR